MIFSIHIPKTAGTSFRKALEERFGDRLALYYGRDDPKTDPLLRVRRNAIASLLPALAARGVEVLHGHYKVRDVVEAITDPETQLWTWLRDPVERVTSHYYFYRERPVTAALGEEVRTGGLSLGAFADVRKMRNLQSSYLRGAALEEFGFVGVTERFELGLAMLFEDAAPKLAMRYNATAGKEAVPDALRTHIAAINGRDVALYGEALALVEDRAAMLGDTPVHAAPSATRRGMLARLMGKVA